MVCSSFLRVCCSLPWKKSKIPFSAPGPPSKAKKSGRATLPFFTWLQHIISFPRVHTPPLPTGLTALTSRRNLQNSLPSASIPAFQLFIRALSSLNLSRAASWWMASQERVTGRVRYDFWNFSGGAVQRRRQTNWGEIGTDLRKERNWRFSYKQTIPPQCPAYSLSPPPPPLPPPPPPPPSISPCRPPHPGFFPSPHSSLAPFCLCYLLSSTGEDCCVFWYMLVWMPDYAH